MPQSGNPYSLYFHIPFCDRKCDYCHFFVVPNQARYHQPLLTALKQQWHLRHPLLPSSGLVSIYFGGGTPSKLSAGALADILSWIAPSAEVEVTLEANPEHLTAADLRSYRLAGINRLSIGVQSFDDQHLQTLSRHHSGADAIRVIDQAAASGFDNLSIDLMYDLPHQTLPSWQETLRQATALPISHLSLYNLTIEPHTVFYKHRDRLKQPEAEVSLQLLNTAVEHLESSGLKRYEISAFGRPSQHNMGYWTNRPFLGFGPSAFSDWRGSRFQNIPNFWRYIHQLDRGIDPISFSETLPTYEREKERVAVGLRLFQGVRTDLSLTSLLEEGWVEKRAEIYSLTPQGRLFYDTVAEKVIALN